MAISDNDLQTLEEWLDGELPESQIEPLRARLATDPELSQAMVRIRDDRQLRSKLFTLLEPSEAAVEQLVADVRRGVRRDEVWAQRVRGIKRMTALAASIVVVFMAGWVSRERLHVGAPVETAVLPHTLPMRPDNPNTVLAGMQKNEEPGRLVFHNPQGGIDLTGVPVAGQMDERPRVYQVLLRDPSGKLFVLQTIDPRSNPQGLIEQFGRIQRPSFPSAPAQSPAILVNSPSHSQGR